MCKPRNSGDNRFSALNHGRRLTVPFNFELRLNRHNFRHLPPSVKTKICSAPITRHMSGERVRHTIQIGPEHYSIESFSHSGFRLANRQSYETRWVRGNVQIGCKERHQEGRAI